VFFPRRRGLDNSAASAPEPMSNELLISFVIDFYFTRLMPAI